MIFAYDTEGKKSGRRFAYLVLFVCFVFISGFQDGLGWDTEYYMSEYDNIPTLSKLDNYDFLRLNRQPGWVVFL